MTTKSSIKYASIDTHHLKNVERKKSSRKSSGGGGVGVGGNDGGIESKMTAILVKSSSATTKNNRRSQSLDRLDENSGDSRAERRNRRQYMHLVGKTTMCSTVFNENVNRNNNLSVFVCLFSY